MKKDRYFVILFVLVIGIIFTSCSLFEDDTESDPPDMSPDWLSHDYIGTLYVNYTNTYPDWNVNTQVDAEISKELGIISFTEGTLSYSGETLVSDDSKIARNGSWQLEPTGELDGDVEHPTISVDAHITVQNDVQKIYAKNNSGDWVLVNEIDFRGLAPSSQLFFDLDEAVLEGSVCGVSTPTGSIVWTLTLSVVPN